jgi:hypothetical protein
VRQLKNRGNSRKRSGDSRINLWGNCMRSIGICAAGRMILLLLVVASSSLNAQTPPSKFVKAPAPPSGGVDGWTLTVKSTIDSGRGTTPRVNISRYRVSAHITRTDIEQQSFVSGIGANSLPVTLTDDSAHTTTLVTEKFRSASVVSGTPRIDLSPRNDSLSRFITTPVMTMRDLGAGETILGHPTHKYSIATSDVTQTTIGDRLCRRTVNSVEQIWAATDLDRQERLRNYVHDPRPNVTGGRGPVQDSLARLRIHRERLINGFVLREIVTNTAPDATGVVRTTTATLEVTELVHGSIPRSVFAIPEGFTTVTMPPRSEPRNAAESTLVAGRKARVDSITKRMVALVCEPDPPSR